MKKLTLIVLLGFASSLKAQITITKEHVVQYGKKIVLASDGSAHNFAASGANKTWDFTDLKVDDVLDTIRFGGADWFKGNSFFPRANYAFIHANDPQTISYLNLSDSSFGFEGFYNFTPSSEDISVSKSTLIRFPSTYNSAFTERQAFLGGVLRIKLDPDTAGPMPFIDSLRIDQTILSYGKIDGWGTLKTPVGSFPSIKQTVLDVVTQTYMIKSAGSWKTASNAVIQKLKYPLPNYDSSYNVSFWTNDINYGFPLLTYYYGPRDLSTNDIEWMIGKASASAIKPLDANDIGFYPNPAQSKIRFGGLIENVSVEIYDVQGQLVETFDTLEKDLNIEHFDTGIYVIKFIDKNTHTFLFSKSLVKAL